MIFYEKLLEYRADSIHLSPGLGSPAIKSRPTYVLGDFEMKQTCISLFEEYLKRHAIVGISDEVKNSVKDCLGDVTPFIFDRVILELRETITKEFNASFGLSSHSKRANSLISWYKFFDEQPRDVKCAVQEKLELNFTDKIVPQQDATADQNKTGKTGIFSLSKIEPNMSTITASFNLKSSVDIRTDNVNAPNWPKPSKLSNIYPGDNSNGKESIEILDKPSIIKVKKANQSAKKNETLTPKDDSDLLSLDSTENERFQNSKTVENKAVDIKVRETAAPTNKTKEKIDITPLLKDNSYKEEKTIKDNYSEEFKDEEDENQPKEESRESALNLKPSVSFHNTLKDGSSSDNKSQSNSLNEGNTNGHKSQSSTMTADHPDELREESLDEEEEGDF